MSVHVKDCFNKLLTQPKNFQGQVPVCVVHSIDSHSQSGFPLLKHPKSQKDDFKKMQLKRADPGK